MLFKRFSALLSAAMLFCGSTPVFAASDDTDDTEIITGKAGQYIQWEYHPDTHLIEFFGSGRMPDYSQKAGNRPPWYPYQTELEEVVVYDGIESIGSYAFNHCSALQIVHLPKTLNDAGQYVFTGCTSLTYIDVDLQNPNFVSLNGVLYSADRTELWFYPNGKTATSFTTPLPVEVIRSGAFAGNQYLRRIVLKEHVNEIGVSAFASCASLAILTSYAKYCAIYDDISTISNRFDREINSLGVHVYDGVIQGYEGSTIQRFALTHGMRFESLGTASPYEKGDFTGDSRIDSRDAQAVLSTYAELTMGNPVSMEMTQISAGDIDGDGMLTANDAQYILEYYLQNAILSLPAAWEEIVN